MVLFQQIIGGVAAALGGSVASRKVYCLVWLHTSKLGISVRKGLYEEIVCWGCEFGMPQKPCGY